MFIKTFKQLTKNDVSIAGGKGASLGEMSNAGLKVPPGFVVLASAFDGFLEEADLAVEVDTKLKNVKYNGINSVTREFSIPCIVSTRVITKVLHDGDLVEADAEKG